MPSLVGSEMCIRDRLWNRSTFREPVAYCVRPSPPWPAAALQRLPCLLLNNWSPVHCTSICSTAFPLAPCQLHPLFPHINAVKMIEHVTWNKTMEAHRKTIATPICCPLLHLPGYVIHPVRPCIQAKSTNRCGNYIGTSLTQHLSIITGIRRRVM